MSDVEKVGLETKLNEIAIGCVHATRSFVALANSPMSIERCSLKYNSDPMP